MIKQDIVEAHGHYPQLYRFLALSVLLAQLAQLALKMACCNPANQPIYQALIDKAASYPANKAYQAKAYRKVAENLLNYEHSIYENYYRLWDIDGVGQSIEDFVRFFIRDTTDAEGQRLHPITQEPFPAEGFTSCCWGAKTKPEPPIIQRETAEGSPLVSHPKEVTGGGVTSEQLRPDTKGNGPFGYLADADETEENDYLTTLIPTCTKITVQELIDSLQAAIKKNPAVAAMEVVPDLVDDSNLGPYDVTIQCQNVFISSGERNPY